MKKAIALILLLALLIPCAALAEDDWALAKAKDLARHMQKLAGDEAYVSLLGMQGAIDLAREMTEADFSEPAAIWRVAIPSAQELYDMISGIRSEDDDLQALTSMTDLGFRELAGRLPSSAISSVMGSALSGDDSFTGWMMLSSMLSASRGYAEPEGFEPCLLLMDFPGRFGVAAVFSRIGDGVVYASAQPVPAGLMASAQGQIDELEAAGIHLDIRRIIAD